MSGAFPFQSAARSLLVRRAMSLQVVAAQNHAESLKAEGHDDIDRIVVEGMEEALAALKGRLAREAG